MAKKKNEVEVVQDIPGADQVIDTSIDMKLSKQDLIDVVVEETRERLENQVADAREAYEVEKNKVDEAHQGLRKLFIEAIENKFAKEFKLLKENGGATRNPSVHDSGWRRGMYATEHGLVGHDELKEENVRTSRGHYGRRTTIGDGKAVEIKYTLPEIYEAANQSKDSDEDPLSIVQINLQLRLSKTESTKLFGAFAKQVKSLGESKAALTKLEEQLRGVDKMGKKAKTQLIKRILESSEGGQALLSNIGAIKANCAQLLLEATK